MAKLRVLVLSFLSMICSKNQAQEMWGIANSNFAGNMGVELNPAAIAFMPYDYEINILSGDLFFWNDYLYQEPGKFPLGRILKGETKQANWSDHYDAKNKNAYGNLLLKGPAAVYRNGGVAYGIHLGMRGMMSVRDVNTHLAKFLFEGSDYSPQWDNTYNTTPYRAAGIAFGEIGVTISQQVSKSKVAGTSAGITLNYLYGMDGLYVRSNNMQYRFDNESMFILNDLDADYGHALPNDGEGNFMKMRGSGFSTTIGMQFIQSINSAAYHAGASEKRLRKYLFKAGASIIDLGYINFNRQAKVYSYENSSTVWPGFDTTDINGINHAGEVISSKIFDNPTEGLAGRHFKTHLPAAASAQVDVCITPVFYTNISAIQPIMQSGKSVRRAKQVAFTPRYETRKFEASLPISLYEYKIFRFGAAVRYGILVLGSDYLSSMFGITEFNGMDFYFGIKYANDKNGGRKRGGKRKHCPAY